ncbi:MAG: hypothetical protein RLZZ234_882 [Candidatus Parcubacteria bacterium]|jgi:hypothetical protein
MATKEEVARAQRRDTAFNRRVKQTQEERMAEFHEWEKSGSFLPFKEWKLGIDAEKKSFV